MRAAVSPQRPRLRGQGLPHAAIERHLALLPMYITGVLLTWQLAVLIAPPGNRDAEGLVKGHDFSHFYTLGTIARSRHPAQLYDARALTETMWRVVPETRPDAFQPLHGPQVALAFAPFAALDYPNAVYAWLATSLALYVIACGLLIAVAPRTPDVPVLVWGLLLLSPALNVLLVAGQTSAVALLAVSLAWWALDRGHPFGAGLALGVLAYKPSLAAGAFAVLLLARQWRMVAGALVSAAVQVTIAWSWAGTTVMRQYLAALAGPVYDAGIVVSMPQHLHSLAGFFRLLLGPGRAATLLYLVAATLVVVLAARAWRRTLDGGGRISVLVLAVVLAAPHLYVYDLVLLAPVLLVTIQLSGQWVGPAARGLSWLAWFTPLSGPIALATRVQPSTLVLVPLFALLSLGPGADRQGDVRP